MIQPNDDIRAAARATGEHLRDELETLDGEPAGPSASSDITGKLPLPTTTRHAAQRLFFRFIVLAVSLNALLGLGLIAFDVADSLGGTRERLREVGEILGGMCTGLMERHPNRAPEQVVAEVAAVSNTPMALVGSRGEILYATDGRIRQHFFKLFGPRPSAGTRFEISDHLGGLSGAWLLSPFVHDLSLLVIVGHSPRDEGLLQYMTISAGVLGLGLAISFWIMLGATRWVLHRPLQRLVDQLTGALARDIERRRSAERRAVDARIEAERHLTFRDNLINASSSVGIVATDAAGTVQIYNRAAERILGYPSDEIVGKTTIETLRRLAQRQPSQEVPLRSLMEPLEGEEFLVDQAGEQHLVAMSRSEIADGEGTRMGELLAFIDVTKPRQLEAELHLNELQLLQSAKMASLGEMATGVAHELNQPLNNIGLMASRMLKRVNALPDADAAFCRERLGRIRDQVERAGRIIDQLRGFGRRSERPLERVDVRLPLGHVEEMLASELEQDGIALRIALPPALPLVKAEPSQLEQVLVNLLLNARDAFRIAGLTPPVGRYIRVEAERRTLEGGRPALALLVRDNGPGMSDEVRSRVFQPFFTTKDPGQGTGLGLSISYGLIRSFGGTLSVESRFGHGAEFAIVLPLADERDEATDDHPADR